jgi:hypothetical protein
MLIKDLICRKKKNDEQEEKDLEDPLPEKLKQCVVKIIKLKYPSLSILQKCVIIYKSVRKDMGVNDHEKLSNITPKLSNITLRHKLK